MEVTGELYTPDSLPLGYRHQYPLNRRPGGPQTQSGYCEVENHFLLLLGIELQQSNAAIKKHVTKSLSSYLPGVTTAPAV
jgi:hypothetical protein